MKKMIITFSALIIGVVLEKKYGVYDKAKEKAVQGLDYLREKAEEAKENIQENLEELREESEEK